jgi:hypothetical protein
MASGQTVLEKMAANKAGCTRKKDLHVDSRRAVLFRLCRMQMSTMSEFAPIIVIELFLVFGGVVLFAWWQLRDLRKEREKRERHQSDQTNSKQ